MSLLYWISLAVLTPASAGLGVYWGIALRRLVRTNREIPTLRDGMALRKEPGEYSPPDVCVVVPAHNEQDNIGRLVASLRAQDYPRLRVLLALDRCTDKTASRAREAIEGDDRFRIVEIETCPDDWAGKVHAAHAALTSSNGPEPPDSLLFLDADTSLNPSCVSAALALVQDREYDLLSVISTLTCDRWYERLVQPAAGFELIYQFPLLRSNAIASRRPFANGQFMLFGRAAYERIGGHEAVKDELLEDLALARRISEADLSCGVIMADGMLSCRMYDSWPQFRSGWKRIYTEAARRRVSRLRRWALRERTLSTALPLAAALHALLAIVWGLSGVVPTWAAITAASIAGAALLVWIVILSLAYRMMGVPIVYAPGYVIGGWLVGSILSEAARDLERGEPTTWAGRSYTRQKR